MSRRWVILLAALAVLAIGAIVLEGVTIFAVITRLNVTHMQVCRLYALQHPLRAVPANCRH
jgi:hypothetical protein